MNTDWAILDTLPIGVQLYDESGQLLRANNAFLSMVGVQSINNLKLEMCSLFDDPLLDEEKKHDLKRRKGVEITGQVTVDKWIKSNQLTTQSSWPIHIERIYRVVSVTPLQYVVTTRDVSERISAIADRKSSETLLRELIETSEDLVFQCDDKGRFIYLNSAWERTHGYAVNEMLGRPFTDFMDPEQASADIEVLKSILKSGRIDNYETYHLNKDGGRVALSFNAKVLTDKFGNSVGTRGIARDITERKKAEENLKNEKERISVTLSSIGDGVIATDIEGRITLTNRVAEILTGWSFENAVNRPLSEVFDIVNDRTGEPCENPVDKVLRTESVVDMDTRTVLKNKEGKQLIISDSGAPIFDADSNIVGVVLVFRDITEKLKLTDSMQRSQRLESLGILAGGIAHDFNNLLGGIFGYIDLAKEITNEDHVRDYLDKAFFTMNRAKGLTQQLLTFAKGGEPVLKPSFINQLSEQSARFALSGTNVCLECRFPMDLWQCDVDENQFGQVVDNIVINAQQAMPDGGEVHLEAKNVHITPGSHTALHAGKYVCVSISDFGTGIPKESLPLIFDPFFTTKTTGSGLGLATCYSIIQKHGGAIDVETETGKGSTFHVYLPATVAKEMTVSLTPTESKKGTGKVLVLDDEEFLREILGTMLESLGFTPICVASGEEATTAFESADPGDKIVAAILDLTIPGGMGGKEAVKAIHEIDADVPVFVSSGYSEDPVMSDPKAYGFVASIAKPFRKHEIYEILCNHIDERAGA